MTTLVSTQHSGASRRSGVRLLVGAAAVVLLAGCASFSPDGGFSVVEQAAKDRLGKEVRWARSESDQATIDQRGCRHLPGPRHHRGRVVQAGRLPNPGFSFGRLTPGDEIELERGLHFNLARCWRCRWSAREARRFEQAQGMAAMSVLSLAADTRKAWVQAVAAESRCATCAR
jgi:hypothetical protein